MAQTVDVPNPEQEPPPSAGPPRSPERRSRIPFIIGGGAAGILLLAGVMLVRASANTNHIALTETPKGVTVALARAASYRGTRRYVATIEPWIRASVGPQLVSGYVDTVLVRPGAVVKRGDVLATLDCRNTSTTNSAVAMQARAIEAKQTALAKESSRISGLLDGGFVSANEAEQKAAETSSMEAQLLATKAKLAGTSLEVNDCVLRSPFDGEVADRTIDPGAFIRPGQAVVSVVDRATVRVVVDVPEDDFEIVPPGVEVHLKLLATGAELGGRISRRAPAADAATRTIHIEIDLPDPDRKIPVGTSAEVKVDVGQPEPAVAVPLTAAQVRGSKATLFVITGGKAHLVTATSKGEIGPELYLDTSVAPETEVVVEGRGLLNEGDLVNAKLREKS